MLVSGRVASAPLTALVEVHREQGAADCPDGAALTRKVERIVHRPLGGLNRGSARISVEVRFRRVEEAYEADVHFRGPKPGERVLRDGGPGCEPLSEAVGVAIALLLDREPEWPESERPEPERPGPERPGPERPEPERSQLKGELGEQLSQSAPSPSELRGSAGGGLAWGFADAESALLTLDLGLRPTPSWLVGATFDAILPSATRFGGGEVRVSLLTGSLRACSVYGRERFFVGACGLFGAGRLRGVGVGYERELAENLLWSAVGGGLVAEGALWARLFAGTTVSLWAPTRRLSFSVQNAGTAWKSTPTWVSFACRLGIRIW